MKKLLYLIVFLPSLCFGVQPFFAGTAANALRVNNDTNLKISTITFSNGSQQTTAYKVLFSSFVYVDTAYGETNSTNFIPLVGGHWITFTTNGGTRVMFGANLQCNSNALAVTTHDVFIDGVDQNVPMLGMKNAAGASINLSMTGLSSVLAAGSHTIDIRMKVDNATYTSYVPFYNLWVKEIQ